MRTPFCVTDDMRSDNPLVAARAYIEAGLELVVVHGIAEDGTCTCDRPECPNPGKHPLTAYFPHGAKSATSDCSLIEQALDAYPDANLAATLKDLTVVEIDGLEGQDAVNRLCLPKTVSVKTCRGMHRYYQGSFHGGAFKAHQVDVITGPNRYIMLPPSFHVSGVEYRWRWSSVDTAAPVPDALEQLRGGSQARNIAGNHGKKNECIRRDTKNDRSGETVAVYEGSRNTRLTSLAGLLRHGGLSTEAIEAALDAINDVICKPPLDTKEIEQIAKSIGRYPTHAAACFGNMADVAAEDISWLYEPYFPRGTITMVEGYPGVSKSTFLTAVAAAVTTGATLSWSRDRVLGNVLLMSAEDDPARVLKTRLESNGADASRVRYQRNLFSLDEKGIATLRRELESHPADLAVIDPIVAFMAPGADLHKAIDMTQFLTEIDVVAREFDCAIAIVRHLRKTKEGPAIAQGLGSIALAGRVRSILLVGRHPREDGYRAVVQIKNNYAEEGPAIVYSIEKRAGHRAPTVEWDQVDESITAAEIADAGIRGVGRPPKQLEEAKKFLRDFLADRPKDSAAVKVAADARSIGGMTLRRAFRELEVNVRRHDRNTLWSLPRHDDTDDDEL